MINTYDLYDLYAVFVGIRSHPDHPFQRSFTYIIKRSTPIVRLKK